MDERLSRRPEAIRAMFARVSSRYDVLNRVLSLRQDKRWRARLARAVAAAPRGRVLDVACGTGDVALAIRDRAALGCDFCLEMLLLARPKARRRGAVLPLTCADALALPFRGASFAAVTIAFGARNLADLDAGLAEMARVVVPGGLVAVLEFQRPPRRAMAALAAAWNRAVVTPVGRLVSHDADAYAYLPASIDTFPDGAGLQARMAGIGLEPIGIEQLSGGIAALTVGRRETR